ncbi:MAG: 16S rRNA (cytidine(1402)-2'-O)-methyltransferase [Synergistaceae bacterium]|nr:16S rRNA (cytidine(1402)-2'-O)-methyltransferase [Synergistaceae bacterium]MBR0076185.1 16S rRNA (cytidine(1402)-2'-O)-methyltransferase [Synergistaceae bacterium]MBR0080229.1 16S rRNA (cytidine(1402)-2'-O)-methyltransferase [Synergistaceae bacterium]MBR0234449.1 16S rRNA (cytidine(1402)-2'-O)-methyltransferase [Synergistaceae bacterium]
MPLTLVPTPIGNLEDITLRALRVLKESDLIACEDTRTSKILLRKYNIDTKLTSFHLYNENEKLKSLIEQLKDGKKISVITDAGTPGISDPGWILLKRSIEEGIEVDVLPGASAIIPAILLSGIEPQNFMFLGFPPEKSGKRIKFFESVKNVESALCFYMSPHKIKRQIPDMIEIFGDRNAALIREISKIHQDSIRKTLSGILEYVNNGVKGELVLIVEGLKV